jgi:hypothetical protein
MACFTSVVVYTALCHKMIVTRVVIAPVALHWLMQACARNARASM